MASRGIHKGKPPLKGGPGGKLTPKMLSFIDAYFGVAKLNATEAYVQSDYTCKTRANAAVNAAELMRHPLIHAEIERRLAVRSEKSEVKAEYLITKLMAIIEATERDNPTAALRAIELAGKSIALWKERQEISGPDGAAIKHEQHVRESVADFTSRIAGLAKRAGAANVVEFPKPRGDDGA